MPGIDMRKHPIYKYLFVDDGDEHVVYRFWFKDDKAEYYGISKKKRVMVRWFEHHSGTLATNVVLTNRLQKEKANTFAVLSCHPSEKSARRAEAACIAAAKKVLNKGGSLSNSIYEKEKRAKKITRAKLRKSPEGPNEKHVVYRYRFKDGATYCGSSSKVRVGFRCYEHRWTTRGNRVLHARLQEEKDYELRIISEHPGEEGAWDAEDRCIRQAAKTINAVAAQKGPRLTNSIYKKELHARKLDRKSRAKAAALRKARREKGLCENCGRSKAIKGKADCAKCHAEKVAAIREYTRQRRRRLAAEGRCVDCCEPKDQASMALQRCRKCLDAINEYRRRKRSKK